MNVRIRSAILAFFFGGLGVDMFLLRPHQVKLFLTLGGACWVLIIAGLVGAIVQNSAGLIFLYAIGAGFLEFWSLARFFEYLNLTDEEFAQRLEGAY